MAIETRSQVILHPSDMTQSDWVRCLLPLMQLMRPNEFGISPSVTHILCTNKEALKKTKAVMVQKPFVSGRAEIAVMYSKLKKECGFKLVTDMDDLMWDLSPVIRTYAKDIPNHDEIVKNRLKQILPLFDTVVCSTRYLASRIKSDLGVNAVVMPNAISLSLFGKGKRTEAFQEKPRVMYAGNLGHCTEELPGDFEGPWLPWLQKKIEAGEIDFYTFGNPPVLKGLEGKYVSIPYTSCLQFPAIAQSFKPDFYLAPLCSHNFNRAKSDLKLKEAAALGAVFIGSDFASSPYSYAPAGQLVGQAATAEELDAKFSELCKPENYMKAIQWQYQAMEEKHWCHEDSEYLKKFVATYFG